MMATAPMLTQRNLSKFVTVACTLLLATAPALLLAQQNSAQAPDARLAANPDQQRQAGAGRPSTPQAPPAQTAAEEKYRDQILDYWEQSSAQYKNFRCSFRRYSYCLLYTSPSPRDKRQSRMPSSA